MKILKRSHFLTILILLLFLVCSCAHAPQGTSSPLGTRAPQGTSTSLGTRAPQIAGEEGLKEPLPLDPQVHEGRLENGLAYLIRANGYPAGRAELRLVVNAGSVVEEEGERGIAHFVEHMAFNGTESFQKQEIVDFLERLGMRFGPELNAYVSFDETVYEMQVPTEDGAVMEKALRILEEWAHRISFDPQEIDKERSVITEEWRLGRGAEARMRDRQVPVLYRGSRYAARLPIGKLEVLQASGAEELRRFYRRWYRPELMAVVAVGDFDPAWMEQAVRRTFSRISADGRKETRPAYPVPDHRETLFAITTDPEATSSRAGLYFKREVEPQGTVADYRRQIVEYLYTGMFNERLAELTRLPDPPFLAGYTGKLRSLRTKVLVVLGAQVREDRILSGLEAVLTEAERIRRFGFTDTELARQKEELFKWMENAYREREKMESAAWIKALIGYFLEGEPLPSLELEYSLYRRLLPGIGLQEVNALAESWLAPANRVVVVNAPQKPGLEIPQQGEFLSLLDRVAVKELAAYRDDVLDRPLLPGSPQGSPVREEQGFPEVGASVWRLANGVRVVLRPTDFKQDQVLFSAFSPGGYSLVPDEELVAAVTAAPLMIEGGVGEFTSTLLQKKLAGKAVEVAPWIDELHEGFQGSARPEDLETLLQLVTLYFTAPRLDPAAFAAYKARQAAALENRRSSPEAVFWDRVQTLITQDHFRARPWTAATLEKMDLDTSYRVFRERFREAGDFIFFFVGNFTLPQMRPLVEKYLGSLPSIGRVETWRDVGVHPPKGVITEKVKKGLEPKSRVQIIFSGPLSWSVENRFLVQSLAEVLDIQLREVLREQLGGTYGVGVEAEVTHFPEQRYQLAIGFGCAPEQAESLSAQVFRQIAALQEGGPQPAHLAKVKEILKRERETQLKENGFWLQSLQFAYAHGLDPRFILDYPGMVESLEAEKLQEASRRYLELGNYLEVFLYPESWN